MAEVKRDRRDLHGIPIDEHGRYFAGGSYYEWYAQQDKIPNVIIHDYRKNCGKWAESNVYWYIFCLAICVGNRSSAPRLDHTFNIPYLRQHWRFHLSMWAMYIIIVFLPLMIDTQPAVIFFFQHAEESLPFVLTFLVLSHILYFGVAWGVLKYNACWRSLFSNNASALQAWEFLLWFSWLMQLASVNVVLLLSYDAIEPLIFSDGIKDDYSNFFRHPAVLASALLLFACGFCIKICMPCISGMNNYYYYDTILHIPNERFVDSSIYKYCHSPTYLLGYVDGYGLFLLAGAMQRGSPTLGLIWMVFQHTNVLLNDKYIEQPNVYKMYIEPNKDQPSAESSP